MRCISMAHMLNCILVEKTMKHVSSVLIFLTLCSAVAFGGDRGSGGGSDIVADQLRLHGLQPATEGCEYVPISCELSVRGLA